MAIGPGEVCAPKPAIGGWWNPLVRDATITYDRTAGTAGNKSPPFPVVST